jgi:hypothetical protein
MIDIGLFRGEIPKVSARLLPDGYASRAVNCDLQEGILKPIKGSTSIQSLDPGAKTIHRLGEQWLQWNNKINVVESFVYDDGRIIFTGDFYPKETNVTLAIGGAAPYPTATRRLGISAPTNAPTCTITTAGSGTDREISYCYTRVGIWLDGTEVESAPSPPSAVFTAKDDAVVKISGFTDASETGSYTTHFRIYRINTGDTGAEYQFVADLAKGTSPLEYSDSIADEDLGEVLPTTDWTAPIDDLKGIIAGSNGLFFGFNGNKVYVSETFIGYAYPDKYVVPVSSEIVGLGFNGSSVVVLTKTVPFFIYGSDPESLSVDRYRVEALPCKAARSIVSILNGVIFATASGLFLIDSGGTISNLTKDLFTKEQWQALGPDKIFAFYFNDAYVAFFEGTTTGIEFKPGSGEIRRFKTDAPVYGGQYVSTVSANTYALLDSDGKNVLTKEGYKFLTLGSAYSLTYDTLYLIQDAEPGREIVALEAGSMKDYEWESKEHWTPSTMVYTAAMIAGDFTAGNVVFDLYIDDVLHFSKTVSSEAPFRIISPKRGSKFKIALTGKTTVERVLVGASMREVMGK